MEIIPLPGVSGDLLLRQLQEAQTWIGNLGQGGTPQVFADYLQWANLFAGTLRNYMERDDVNRLITTPRYWALTDLIPFIQYEGGATPPTHVYANGLLNLEIQERRSDFAQITTRLKEELQRWKEVRGVLVVADTNVYLHHEMIFTEIAWSAHLGSGDKDVHLVIPSLIVDELDGQKRTGQGRVGGSKSLDVDEVKTRARKTLSIIDDLFPRLSDAAEVRSVDSPLGQMSASLLLDGMVHIRHPRPDTELLNRALALQELTTRQVVLVTFDTGMALRARMTNMKAINLTKASNS
jgi:hypothetical protein